MSKESLTLNLEVKIKRDRRPNGTLLQGHVRGPNLTWATESDSLHICSARNTDCCSVLLITLAQMSSTLDSDTLIKVMND